MTAIAPAEMEVIQCRYCLESDGSFVSPCQCSGTSQYVHMDCLNQWRHTNPNYKDICRECGAHYFWQQIHYGETFVLCEQVSLFMQYVLGTVVVLAVTSVIIATDPYATTFQMIEPVWGANITDTLHNNTALRVFYSVSLAGSIIYGILWILLITSTVVYLNHPCSYFQHLWLSYTCCGISSQYHFICIFGLGFFPILALSFSSVCLLMIPFAFFRLTKRHNAYITSRNQSSVILATTSPILRD